MNPRLNLLRIITGFLWCAFLFASVQPITAQTDYAKLTVVVKDLSKNPVSNASVTLHSVGANSLRLLPLHEKNELAASLAFRDNKAFLEGNRKFNAEDEGSMRAKDVFGVLSATAKKLDSSNPF